MNLMRRLVDAWLGFAVLNLFVLCRLWMTLAHTVLVVVLNVVALLIIIHG
jgi:hypothetical protein